MVGNSAEVSIEYDPNYFNGLKRSCMIIKVKLDVTKPLKKTVTVNVNGKGTRILFKYECLSIYCYGFGLMGHSEKFRKEAYSNAEGVVKRIWSTKLRAH